METCKTCKRFHQHYVRRRRGDYTAMGSGHCVKPRLKSRRCETPACANWEAKNIPKGERER